MLRVKSVPSSAAVNIDVRSISPPRARHRTFEIRVSAPVRQASHGRTHAVLCCVAQIYDRHSQQTKLATTNQQNPYCQKKYPYLAFSQPPVPLTLSRGIGPSSGTRRRFRQVAQYSRRLVATRRCDETARGRQSRVGRKVESVILGNTPLCERSTIEREQYEITILPSCHPAKWGC